MGRRDVIRARRDLCWSDAPWCAGVLEKGPRGDDANVLNGHQCHQRLAGDPEQHEGKKSTVIRHREDDPKFTASDP